MAICCCSLAGTAACKHCNNNPDAEIYNKNLYVTYYYTDPREYDPTSSNHFTNYEYNFNNNCISQELETTCKKCGVKLLSKYNYCPNCGAKKDGE